MSPFHQAMQCPAVFPLDAQEKSTCVLPAAVLTYLTGQGMACLYGALEWGLTSQTFTFCCALSYKQKMNTYFPLLPSIVKALQVNIECLCWGVTTLGGKCQEVFCTFK